MSSNQPTTKKKRGNVAVYRRIENENNETIFEMLQQQDLKAIDSHGNSLLHLLFKNKKLASKKLVDVLEMLLDQGADPNIKNDDELTVLHLAVEKRLKEVVDLLINRGADIEVSDKNGNSIAHYFIETEKFTERTEQESASFAEWLISKGIDFDRRNNRRHSQSALHLAIDRNLQHILPTLLRHSSDVNFVAKRRNKNLLHFFLEANEQYRRQTNVAKYTRRYAVDIVKILLDKGVSGDTVSADGKTPLDLALQTYDETDVIEMIVDRFTNVHHKNEFGQTSLHRVLANRRLYLDSVDYPKMIRCLVERGSDVDCPDNSGTRPIHLVVNHPCDVEQTLELLANAGCDVNAKDAEGETALRLAVLETNVRVARKLVELGADVDYLDTRETTTTPLQMAAKRESSELVELLLDGGADIDWKDGRLGETALRMAVKWNRVANVRSLLRRGADTHAIDNDGETVLYAAITRSDVSIVREFIDHGVDVNRPMPGHGRTTPFVLAITKGDKEAVELMLDKGADVNRRDSVSGDRPLHAALAHRSGYEIVEIVGLLLRRGARVNALNCRRESALVLGMKSRNCDIVDVLLEYGADVDDPKQFLEPSTTSFLYVYPYSCRTLITQHLIKLQVAKINRPRDCDAYAKRTQHQVFHERCLAEVKKLRETPIDSRYSLYRFLTMQPSDRCTLISNAKLKELVDSPELKKQFPVYAAIVLANYREAVARKPLLEPAKEAWHRLTGIFLPDLCVERILDYLVYEDLIRMIQDKRGNFE